MRWLVGPVALAVAVTAIVLLAWASANLPDASAQGDQASSSSQPEATPTEPPVEVTVEEEPAQPQELEPTPTEPPVEVTVEEEPAQRGEPDPEPTPTEPEVEVTVDEEPTPQRTPRLEGPGVVQGEPDEKDDDGAQPRNPIYDTPPPTPSDVSASGTEDDSVTVSWTGAFGVSSYRVQYMMAGDSSWTTAGSTTATSTTVTDLMCNTSYSFQVEALGDGIIWQVAWSDPSTAVDESTTACPPVPPPSGLTATPDQYSVSLSWSKPAGVALQDFAFYRVDQQQSDGTWEIVGYTQKTVTAHTETGLGCNMGFRFRVAARGDGKPYLYGYVSFSEVPATTTVCPPVPPPSGPAATPDQYSVSLSWNRPTGVALEDIAFYRIDQQQSDGTWRIVAYTRKTVTTYTRTELGCNMGFSFRVAARGDGKPYLDQYTRFGEVSATTTACPPVPAPRNLSWTADETSVSLDWDDPAGVALEDIVFYRVDQRQGGTWRIVAYTQKTETAYRRAGLSPGTTYNFRVAARGRGKPYLDEYELFATTSATTAAPADPVVSISASPTSVTEGGTITFTVAADTAPTSGLPVSVTVSGAEGFVTGTTPSPVTIPADETSVSFRVETEDDCRDETNGTVTATLSAGTGYTVGNPGSASASVTDNDQPPSVSVSVSSASVRAGDSVTFTVTSDCAPADPLRVNVEVTQVGSFVTTPFPSFWTIPGNGLGDSFPLTTRPAAAGEVAGSVTAAIRSGAGYQVGTPSSATAGILVPDTAPPPALVEADAGERSVDLTWSAVTDGHRYQVERSLDDANWSVIATPTGTSYEDRGLACNETYYYRVATKGDGTRYSTNYGVPSASVPATTTAPCPNAPAPTGLDGTATRTTVRLTWDTRADVAAYKIEYRERASSSSDPWTTVEQDGTSYPATNLTCGTEYAFRVSARGDGSPYSTTYGAAAELSRRTSACPPAPAPDGLDTEPGRQSVRLTWDPRTDVVEYRIEYRESASSDPWTTVERGGTSYTASGLICDGEDGREYTFRVSARGDGSPYSTTYGTAAVITEEPECPTLPDADAPDDVRATTSDDDSVTLAWTEVEHAEGYRVEYVAYDGPGSPNWDVLGYQHVDVSSTTPTVMGLFCGTKYYFRVRSLGDGTDTDADYGTASTATVSRKTTLCPPPVPTRFRAAGVAETSITLQWNDADYAMIYKVERRDLSDPLADRWIPVGDEVVDYNPSTDRYEHPVTGLTCGTSYTFRILARGDGTKTLAQFTDPNLAPQISPTTAVCPVVSIAYTPPPGTDPQDPLDEGALITFTVTAGHAPVGDLVVAVSVTEQGGMFLGGTPPLSKEVTIVPPRRSATFTVQTDDDDVHEPDGAVTATISNGDGYTVGSPRSTRVPVEDNDPEPDRSVTISASALSVTEGGGITFTVTADEAPSSDLVVGVVVTQVGRYLTGTVPTSVTILADQSSASFSVATEDDCVDDTSGSVTATLLVGTGYAVGNPGLASVSVADDDLPPVVTISVNATEVMEGAIITFTVTASCRPPADLHVNVGVDEEGEFILSGIRPMVVIPVDRLSDEFEVETFDDAADELDGEIIALILGGTGYTVGGVGASSRVTVTDNDDAPMNLTVDPLPLQRALLRWEYAGTGTSFRVDARSISLDDLAPLPGATPTVVITATTPSWQTLGTSASESYAIDLKVKAIPGFRTYNTAVEVRVIDTSVIPNVLSDSIYLIDNPVLRVDGDSRAARPMEGKASVKWSEGRNATKYTIRHRKLPEPTGPFEWPYAYGKDVHADDPNNWTGDHAWDETDVPAGGLAADISGLDLEEFYAVHVNYVDATSRTFFAFRDAYVWPATSSMNASQGKRLATVPLRYPMQTRTYTYRICTNFFPQTKLSEWETIIDHAFKQWEFATDEFITVQRETDPCEKKIKVTASDGTVTYKIVNYEKIIEEIDTEFGAECSPPTECTLPTDPVAKELAVVAYITKLDLLSPMKAFDEETNEVTMLDISRPEHKAGKRVSSLMINVRTLRE